MVTIDQDKCIGCMKCVEVCPFTVLENKDGRPEPQADRICVKCLHCAAACPQNAICLGDLDGILPGELPQLPAGFQKQLEGHLMTRRSYRHFKPESVAKEILEHALRVSAWAPSAKNQHPAKWIVVSDDGKIKKMMEIILEYVRETGVNPEIAKIAELGRNVVMGNAKTLLIAYTRTNAINAPVDSALALYTAELMLQAEGVGTCWAGYLTRMCNNIPALRELLNVTEDYQFTCALMVGYPEDEEYIHIPNRQKMPDIQ